MSLCCTFLTELADNRGLPGISIVLSVLKDDFLVRLVSRACAEDEEHHIGDWLRNYKGVASQLRVVTEIGMRYCPFCGADIEAYVKANRENVDQYIVPYQ